MSNLMDLPVADLHPREDNLRVTVDGTSLVNSVKSMGILQPLRVTPRSPLEGEGYWIDAGHRRHHAATLAKLKTVPCMVNEAPVDEDTDDHTYVMLVENLQRTDLNPIEEAEGYKRLVDYGVKQGEIARETGISQSGISRRLALLKLPDEVIELVRSGELDLSLADLYTKLPAGVANIAAKERWNAMRVERALEAEARKKEVRKLTKVADDAGVMAMDSDAHNSPRWKTSIDTETQREYRWTEILVDKVEKDEDGTEVTTHEQVHARTPVELQALVAEHKPDAVWVTHPSDFSGGKSLVLMRRQWITPEGEQATDSKAAHAEEIRRLAEVRRQETAEFRSFLSELSSRTYKAPEVSRRVLLFFLANADWQSRKFIIEVRQIPTEVVAGQHDDEGWQRWLGGLDVKGTLQVAMLLMAYGYSTYDQTSPQDEEADAWFAELGFTPTDFDATVTEGPAPEPIDLGVDEHDVPDDLILDEPEDTDAPLDPADMAIDGSDDLDHEPV